MANKKKIYTNIKQFLIDHADAIQRLATQHHKEFIGGKRFRSEIIKRYQDNHRKIVYELAQYLEQEDIKKGLAVFKRLAETIAKDSVKDGLYIEEAVDGIIFLKQALWEKIEEAGLLNQLSAKDFYHISQSVGMYIDTVSSKIAFTFHSDYTGKIAKELAERQRTEQVLIDERKFAEDIVETVREPLVVLDDTLHVVSANESFYHTFKVTPKQTEKKLIYKLGNNQWDIPQLRKLLTEILPKKKQIHNYEVEHTFSTIGKKTMLLNARSIDHVKLILLAIEDITERKEAEEKLSQSAAIIESSDDAIMSMDTKGRITSWNHGAEKLYGYTASEIIGKPLSILMPPNKKSDFHTIMQQLLQGKRIEHYETQRMAKNRRVFDVSITESPIRNNKGEIIGASKIARDITEQKRLENNLRFLSEASKLLSSSLDYRTTLQNVAKLAVPQIADWCTVDMLENGTLKQVAIAHKDPKQVKWAKELRKTNPPDMNAPTGIPHVLKTGKAEFYPEITDELLVKAARNEKELTLLRKLRFTSVMLVPICTEGTCIGGISFVSTDSKRHYTKSDVAMAEELASRAAFAIENAKLFTESEKAVALRDDFISVASHELKTPVTSLKMYTQVLQKEFAKRGQQEFHRYFHKIDDQANKLSILINDLLNVSKLQHGKLEFAMGEFDLNEVVKDTVDAIQETASKHKIIVEGELPRRVYGDRYRIYQVITNLLTNAIKYSPQADRVLVQLIPEKDVAVVTVRDFGIGIEKEYQNKIFQQFYRVNAADEKTYPGLGMGLFIAYEMVKRHGGDMTVVSEKGKGSQFSFTLPYKG